MKGKYKQKRSNKFIAPIIAAAVASESVLLLLRPVQHFYASFVRPHDTRLSDFEPHVLSEAFEGPATELVAGQRPGGLLRDLATSLGSRSGIGASMTVKRTLSNEIRLMWRAAQRWIALRTKVLKRD